MKHVWVLMGFDRSTETEVEAIELRHLTDVDIRRILGLPPEEELEGGWDIVPPATQELEQAIGRPLRSDLDYQIAPFADDT